MIKQVVSMLDSEISTGIAINPHQRQGHDELMKAGSAAEDLISRAVDLFQSGLALATSFSIEDVALIHMLVSADPGKKATILAIDTGRLPEDTFACAQALIRKYAIEIEWLYPNPQRLANFVSSQGLYSFKESLEARKECCYIRKVEPLRRRLRTLSAWITGQRREQTHLRSQLQVVEIDKANGSIVKLNPLCYWTSEQVFQYVKHNNIPYSRLYDRGYKSIGCAPCTRPVAPHEDERAGRWWWESDEHKECGIHVGEANTACANDRQ